ncbi:MAG: ABC transporter ATP-binding protein [candidate division Zixibacteria bacterium]|nr:ABC transporter ATP-binding protein [candidate division Zixibacteria bacterium]
MIKFKNVAKKFGNYTAVDNLNLEVQAGELFGFLGPNGAGKTTTIKMMTGILKPTSGSISVGETDIQKEPEKAKKIIGYIPDDPFLYDRLTGREHLEFVGGLYHLDQDTIQKRSEELFEIFDMNGWIDKRCEEYSHGMCQKLVFCSAFIHNPSVLVVDEPMVGLDPQSARIVKDLLKTYASKGTTIFISTHVLSVAEELCGRIGIINNGKLIGLGTLEELKKQDARNNINLEALFLDLINNQI